MNCLNNHFGLNVYCNLCEEIEMPTEAKTKFNPKIGAGFSNDRFGKGSILVKVDQEGLDNIMKNLQVGSSILLRFNRKTVKDNDHYFCEILPPLNKQEATPVRKTTKTTLTGVSDLD